MRAAFWLLADLEIEPYLYVVSDEFEGETQGEAYLEVLSVSRRLRDPYFDPFRVKLITTGDPLGKTAVELLNAFHHGVGVAPRRGDFGNTTAYVVHIYPNLAPVA